MNLSFSKLFLARVIAHNPEEFTRVFVELAFFHISPPVFFLFFWNICLQGVSHVMVISSTECFDKVGNISLNYEQKEKPSKEKGMEITEINLWSHLFIQFLKNVNIKCNKCKRNCNFHFVWRSWRNSTEKTAFFHESLTESLRSYGRVKNFLALKSAVFL